MCFCYSNAGSAPKGEEADEVLPVPSLFGSALTASFPAILVFDSKLTDPRGVWHGWIAMNIPFITLRPPLPKNY